MVSNLGWNYAEIIKIKLQQFSPLKGPCPEDVESSLRRSNWHCYSVSTYNKAVGMWLDIHLKTLSSDNNTGNFLQESLEKTKG